MEAGERKKIACSVVGCTRYRKTARGKFPYSDRYYVQSIYCAMHLFRFREEGKVGSPESKRDGHAWNSGHGYLRVNIGKGKWVYLHRLRYEQAFGPIPEGYHIHHMDGDKLNNHPMNLMMMSESEHHKFHHGAWA